MRSSRPFISVILSMTLVFSFLPSLFPNSASVASAASEKVEVWVTTGDKSKLLSKEPDVAFTSTGTSNRYTIQVDENKSYQEIEGFGAALTDSSAWLFGSVLPDTEKAKVIEQLFDPNNGVGFSYIRLPMGSSDFARSHYTYNDTEGNVEDPDLVKFSIDHDREYIIPVLKQALALSPEIKVMGSPWSAPAWMKDNKSLAKGKLKPEYYGAYAQYFVKFIQAYAAEGIKIDAVTIQNEPHHEAGNYASMRMEAAEQAEFIKNYLGPAFEATDIRTKIITWDHNWNEPEYPIEILNDPAAKKYIAGSAFHGYAGSVENQAQVHDLHPDRGIYFTESSGGDFSPVFGNNLVWDVQNLIIGATRNWAKTSLKWNLALDEEHGPRVGGCTDCRGVVTANKESKTITSLNEEYYAFGHASKFVRPGAVRIKSNTFGDGSIENVAFKNKDGSKALIVLNSSKAEREFKVQWGGGSFAYILPAGAVATFKWDGSPVGETGVNPYSKVEAEDYSDSKGIETGIVADTGGGGYVAPVTADSYIAFNHVEFLDGTATVKVRAATEQDATIEFRLDSPDGQYLGGVHLMNTGGRQTWVTKSASIERATGTHKLYVVLKGQVNLNWFQFSFDHSGDTLNYLSYNGGFEEGSLEGWKEWTPEGQNSVHKVELGDSRSGEYKLTHWSGQAYEQRTYRTVQVPNGTYKASVWLRKGDNISIQLQTKNYGGPDLAVDADVGFIGDYKQYVINNIRVTNGQLELGVHSKSSVGEWATFDDFELTHVTTYAPAAGNGTNAPAAPQNVTASVVAGYNAKLQWESLGDQASGYKIYRSVKSLTGATVTDSVYVDFSEIGLTGPNQVTFTDQGLRGDTTYYYVVTAFNTTGESVVSQEVGVTTSTGVDSVPPSVPSGLTAVPGIEKAMLRWNYNLESDFLRYHVYQNDVRIASVESVTESRYIINNLTPGMEYQFAVSAVDKAGNESAKSPAVAVIPMASGLPMTFDNMDFEKGSFDGWAERHPEQQAIAQFIDNDSPRGQYKLTHWGSGDYIQSTYRTIQVPNGKYKVQVWVRTGGGQNKFQLEVKNYGGGDLARDMKKTDGGKWTSFYLDNIQVTNGQMEIGVLSDAKGGNWAAIDDFQVFSYAPAGPTGIKAIAGDQSASLQWKRNTEHDMASYNVYQDGKFVHNVTSATVVIHGLINEQSYSFTISGVDTAGNESLSSAAVRVTPRVPVFVDNAGFENGDATGWSSWSSGDKAQFVDKDGPRTGKYKLTHWAGADYKQNTYRTISVTSVTYDTYQASIWVRTGADLNALRMEIKKYGGDDLQLDMSTASSSDWSLFVSKPFQVKTGEVEIGLFSDSKAGNWTAFDDFQLIRVDEENIVPVSGLTMAPTELSLNLTSNRTRVLTAVVTPSTATNKDVKWSSDNKSVATVTDGVVSAVGVGVAAITVTTVDGGFAATAKVTVTADSSIPDPGTNPSANPTPGSTTSPMPSGKSTQNPIITVDGKTSIITNLSIKENLLPGGNKIAIIDVSSDVLKEASVKGQITKLLFELTGVSQSQSIKVVLPAKVLNEIALANTNMALAMKTARGEYELPLSALLPAIQQGDGKAAVLIEIEQGEDTSDFMSQKAKAEGFSIRAVVPAFHIKLQAGDTSTDTGHFGKKYLSRMLTLDSQTNLSNVTGVAIDPATGKMKFVPLMVMNAENGKIRAELRTNYSDNSILAIIQTQPKTFKDIQTHWAKTDIETLASKFIVQGLGAYEFSPKQQISRAEWISMLVRALGMGELQQGSQFADLSDSTWYAGSVEAAVQAGLIQGFTDGTFRPHDFVTKEQMAITLVKAMELTESRRVDTVPNQNLLQTFKDGEDVSVWAQSAMAHVVDAGMISGDGKGLLQPNNNASRAEAVVILHKLLKQLKFISP